MATTIVKAIRPASCAICRPSLSCSSSAARHFQSRLTSNCFSRINLRARFSSQVNSESALKLLRNSSVPTEGHPTTPSDEDTQDDADLGAATRTVSSLPWYLQLKTSELTMKPLSERQLIPELPPLPPPILGPLLHHISIDLGLDSLSVLDLRKLDPPPALGANLIMVLGTARSEKHLHVSADRLCRWLRSTYKLRPDADGLLGRNEMKLRLRRKSRRAKLMGNVIDENGDDGVRTGWVCVDIGAVEGVSGVEDTAAPATFVGFGRRTDGVRVVVQMLTEEKREEMDLERLWTGILRRSLTGAEQQEAPELDARLEKNEDNELLSVPS